jgi:hypothetical protein
MKQRNGPFDYSCLNQRIDPDDFRALRDYFAHIRKKEFESLDSISDYERWRQIAELEDKMLSAYTELEEIKGYFHPIILEAARTHVDEVDIHHLTEVTGGPKDDPLNENLAFDTSSIMEPAWKSLPVNEAEDLQAQIDERMPIWAARLGEELARKRAQKEVKSIVGHHRVHRITEWGQHIRKLVKAFLPFGGIIDGLEKRISRK